MPLFWSVVPPDEPQTLDQSFTYFVNCHDVQLAGGKARYRLLVDSEAGAFHFLVHHTVEFWVVGETLGVDLADFIKAVADHLASDEIGNYSVGRKQRAVTVYVVGIVDFELAIDDVAWGGFFAHVTTLH